MSHFSDMFLRKNECSCPISLGQKIGGIFLCCSRGRFTFRKQCHIITSQKILFLRQLASTLPQPFTEIASISHKSGLIPFFGVYNNPKSLSGGLNSWMTHLFWKCLVCWKEKKRSRDSSHFSQFQFGNNIVSSQQVDLIKKMSHFLSSTDFDPSDSYGFGLYLNVQR